MLKGTENVLGAVNKASSVRRVVLTSSVVALYGLNDEKKGPYDESDWNKTSSLTVRGPCLLRPDVLCCTASAILP